MQRLRDRRRQSHRIPVASGPRPMAHSCTTLPRGIQTRYHPGSLKRTASMHQRLVRKHGSQSEPIKLQLRRFQRQTHQRCSRRITHRRLWVRRERTKQRDGISKSNISNKPRHTSPRPEVLRSRHHRRGKLESAWRSRSRLLCTIRKRSPRRGGQRTKPRRNSFPNARQRPDRKVTRRNPVPLKDRPNAARQLPKDPRRHPRSRRSRRLNQIADKFVTLGSVTRPDRLRDRANSQIEGKSLHPSPDLRGIMLRVSHLQTLRESAPSGPRSTNTCTHVRESLEETTTNRSNQIL